MVASPAKIRGQSLKAMLVLIMIELALVAFGDDLKKQLCAALVQGQISQFVQKC
jgi:hypothetical protein